MALPEALPRNCRGTDGRDARGRDGRDAHPTGGIVVGVGEATCFSKPKHGTSGGTSAELSRNRRAGRQRKRRAGRPSHGRNCRRRRGSHMLLKAEAWHFRRHFRGIIEEQTGGTPEEETGGTPIPRAELS